MKKIAGLCLLAALCSGCTFASQPMPTPAVPETAVPVAAATGEVVPAVWATLSTPTGGTIEAVLVKPGDAVQAGDLLVRFDSTDARLAVQQAEVALQSAQSQLVLLQAGARPEDIAAARSAVSATLSSIAGARAGLPAATEQARLAWVQSANLLRDAQAACENIYWENRGLEERLGAENLPDANRDAEARAWRAVENAQAAMEQARLTYEQAQQREKAALGTAWGQLQTARANLAQVSAGVRPEEAAVAQTAIAQAEVSLQVAQVALDRCQIRATFAGTVGDVHARAGEMVTPGQPLVTVGDLTTLRVETTDLAEMDVGRVAVGQKATITFDVLPERVFSGRVVSISPMPRAGSSGVHYTAVIVLDQLDPAMRWGMTAFVRIELN